MSAWGRLALAVAATRQDIDLETFAAQFGYVRNPDLADKTGAGKGPSGKPKPRKPLDPDPPK